MARANPSKPDSVRWSYWRALFQRGDSSRSRWLIGHFDTIAVVGASGLRPGMVVTEVVFAVATQFQQLSCPERYKYVGAVDHCPLLPTSVDEARFCWVEIGRRNDIVPASLN